MAFKRRNTLHPAMRKALATSTAIAIAASTGVWIEPDLVIPVGRIDAAAIRQARVEAAEKSLDRKAQQSE